MGSGHPSAKYTKPFGRLREKCLNQNWFLSLDDAKQKVEAWRQEFNRTRPHGALGNLAPEEFAEVTGTMV
jgi:putative transposase